MEKERNCKVFYCGKKGDRICCWDCGEKEQCKKRCTNNPDTCGLVWTGKRSKVGQTLKEAFRELWEDGMNDVEIAGETGVSKTAVLNWRRREGLGSNYRKRETPKARREEAKILALYDEKLNDQEIAQRMGCSVTKIRAVRLRRGLPSNWKRK